MPSQAYCLLGTDSIDLHVWFNLNSVADGEVMEEF